MHLYSGKRICLIAFLFVINMISGTQKSLAEPDKCKDILSLGYYKTEIIESKTYLRDILEARYARASSSDTKKDVGGEIKVPLEDFIVGAKYSQSDREKRKEQIKNSLDIDRTFSNESAYLLISGDKDIVNSWKSCMDANASGIYAHFELPNPREPYVVNLMVQYRGSLGINDATVQESYNIEGGKIKSGAHCLQKDTKIINSVPCITQIQMKDAWTTLAPVIQTNRGVATAYLPPRVHLVREIKAMGGVPPVDAYYAGKAPSDNREIQLRISGRQVVSPSDFSDGWFFNSSVSDIRFNPVHYPDKGSCVNVNIIWQLYQVDYNYLWDTNDSGGSTICQFDIKQIVLQRSVLRGLDGSIDPSQKIANSQPIIIVKE